MKIDCRYLQKSCLKNTLSSRYFLVLIISLFSCFGIANMEKHSEKLKYSEVMERAIAPMQNMSEVEILIALKENSKNSKIQKIFEQHPKLNIFRARLLKDKKALPELAKILDDGAQLSKYSLVMLVTILVGILLRRLMKLDDPLFLFSLILWLVRLSVMALLRLGITIAFFGPNLKPIYEIAMRTFF